MDIAAKVELTSENTTVWGVDPGLKDVYIGSDGSMQRREEKHMLRSLHEVAKRLLSGSTKYGYIVEERIRQNEQKWKPLDPQDSTDEERKAVVIAFGDASIPTSMAGIRSGPNKLL
ncbi:MAG: hypothetical protein EXX96DRAFT_651463 [Benjaminiella poitrasii]|nr:MAG: hypothetical protein EXX96DRAFT_651463 [Benjaminiella poitrasii]